MARRVTADWIRGFADRSCQIVGGRSPAIVMTATDDYTLRIVWSWLNGKGYRARVTPGTANYTLRIGGIESLRLWRQEVGFFDQHKLNLLDEVISVADASVPKSS
jgi:hypothetical protein